MKIVVIGAGVSGAHAALTLLERNFNVELWDVGREETDFPNKGATFHELKGYLPDPVDYFLGHDLSALIPPTNDELLRYPPSRRFLASDNDSLWDFVPDGFSPFASFSKGGLANGWGANALSFGEDDLTDWPISFSDMEAAYKTAYDRIPVAGPTDDDLRPFLTGVYASRDAVRPSATDQVILQSYKKSKRALERLGIRIGLARLAVSTDPDRDDACDYCDRCLWGCPRGAIYNPALSTLKTCERNTNFRYVPRRLVISLVSGDDKITGIEYLDTTTKRIHQAPCDAVFLAAGTLQTGSIFLRTLKAAKPEISPETEGLMDTSVVKIPYLALRNVGRRSDDRCFQFNRLIMGIVNKPGPWPNYLHGEMLQLSSLMYHPLIESLPFDSRLSKRLFFSLKPALGVITLFFPDKITPGNRQMIRGHGEPREKIQLLYRESDEKKDYIRQSVSRVRAALWHLRCIPKGIVKATPGAGIHYAGTVPMGTGPKRCDRSGRSNLFSNLFLADGAAFPSLPSKSITMSLAAHATRVAREAPL